MTLRAKILLAETPLAGALILIAILSALTSAALVSAERIAMRMSAPASGVSASRIFARKVMVARLGRGSARRPPSQRRAMAP